MKQRILKFVAALLGYRYGTLTDGTVLFEPPQPPATGAGFSDLGYVEHVEAPPNRWRDAPDVCGARGGFLGASPDVCQLPPDHGGAIHLGRLFSWARS
jgi:hypothetical protein